MFILSIFIRLIPGNWRHGFAVNLHLLSHHYRIEFVCHQKNGFCGDVTAMWLSELSVQCAQDHNTTQHSFSSAPLHYSNTNMQWTSAVSVDNPQRVSDLSIQKTVVSSSVCSFLVIVVAAAAVFVGITRRNKHQTNGKVHFFLYDLNVFMAIEIIVSLQYLGTVRALFLQLQVCLETLITSR